MTAWLDRYLAAEEAKKPKPGRYTMTVPVTVDEYGMVNIGTQAVRAGDCVDQGAEFSDG